MSQTKFKVIENNNMMKENRNKSLEAAVGLIEKNYGKGSIMKLGSKSVETRLCFTCANFKPFALRKKSFGFEHLMNCKLGFSSIWKFPFIN